MALTLLRTIPRCPRSSSLAKRCAFCGYSLANQKENQSFACPLVLTHPHTECWVKVHGKIPPPGLSHPFYFAKVQQLRHLRMYNDPLFGPHSQKVQGKPGIFWEWPKRRWRLVGSLLMVSWYLRFACLLGAFKFWAGGGGGVGTPSFGETTGKPRGTPPCRGTLHPIRDLDSWRGGEAGVSVYPQSCTKGSNPRATNPTCSHPLEPPLPKQQLQKTCVYIYIT